jgi:hypothetical protein
MTLFPEVANVKLHFFVGLPKLYLFLLPCVLDDRIFQTHSVAWPQLKD